MAGSRIVRLTQRFHASQKAHAPAGSAEYRAVQRVIRELAAEPNFPGPADVETTIPPSLTCLGRPIPSAGLVVCYRATDTELVLLGVKRA